MWNVEGRRHVVLRCVSVDLDRSERVPIADELKVLFLTRGIVVEDPLMPKVISNDLLRLLWGILITQVTQEGFFSDFIN